MGVEGSGDEGIGGRCSSVLAGWGELETRRVKAGCGERRGFEYAPPMSLIRSRWSRVMVILRCRAGRCGEGDWVDVRESSSGLSAALGGEMRDCFRDNGPGRRPCLPSEVVEALPPPHCRALA